MRGFQFAKKSNVVSVTALGFVGSAFIGSMALAQAPSTAPAADSTTSSTLSNPAPSSTTSVPVTGGATATQNTGTSSAQLKTVAPAAKRPYSFSILSQSNIKNDDVIRDNKSMTTENFVAAKYQLTESRSIQLRQNFLYTTASRETAACFITHDIALNYVDSKVAEFKDGSTVTAILRYSLPTGEKARFVTETNGNVIAWGILNKSIGKVDLAAHLYTRAWLNQKDGYVTTTKQKDGAEKSEMTNNLDYDVNPFVSAGYNLSEVLAVSMSVGVDHVWYRPVAGTGMLREQTFDIAPTITFTPVKNFQLILDAVNSINVYNPTRAVQLYRGDETTFHAIVSASI